MWSTDAEKRLLTERAVKTAAQTLDEILVLNSEQKELSKKIDEKIKDSKSQLRMIVDLTIAPAADYEILEERHIRIEFDRPLFPKFGFNESKSELLVQPKTLEEQVRNAVRAVKKVSRVEARSNYITIEFKIPKGQDPEEFGKTILWESLNQISRVMVAGGYLSPIFEKAQESQKQ